MQHRCRPGETYDSIAFREYGDSFKASAIIAENPRFADVVMFEGGELINLPETADVVDTSGLPPWRQ